MSPLLSLLEVESCPSEHHLMSVLHEILDELLEIERARTAVNKRHIVN